MKTGNLTLKSIGDTCGVSRSTISRWLRFPDAPDRKQDPERCRSFCLLMAGNTHLPQCKPIERELWGRYVDDLFHPRPDESDEDRQERDRQMKTYIYNEKYPEYVKIG